MILDVQVTENKTVGKGKVRGIRPHTLVGVGIPSQAG